MAKKTVKILIACGSGIATSTVAQEAVREILDQAGIQATLIKGTLSEISMRQDDVDLILVTANYRKKADKPVIPVFGLLSGIGEEEVARKIVGTCRQIIGEDEERTDH